METHKLTRSLSQVNKPLFINTGNNCFSPIKKKTDPFFYNSKVGSCSYVVVNNTQSKAIPFQFKNSKGRGLNNYKRIPKKLAELKSVYFKDYLPVPDLHCGMKSKPLIPYSPDSSRSRMPLNGFVIGMNNRSYFTFGNNDFINRKQWSSTYRDYFRWPKILPISNPGINSDINIRYHKKLNE